MHAWTHKYKLTSGGCPKVSDPEGRTQKLRKQLGVREVLGLVAFPRPGPLLIELLLCWLFYRPQKQVSIWFPLFLCWQGIELASFCLRMAVLLIHKEIWHWFIHTHWASPSKDLGFIVLLGFRQRCDAIRAALRKSLQVASKKQWQTT